MNRLFLPIATLLTGLLPLIIDSALKGAALLVLAGVIAMALCKASAAARHLVWLVAVLSLLIVPLLSVALPEWRVLPGWARVSTVNTVSDTAAKTDATIAIPSSAESLASELPDQRHVFDLRSVPAINPVPIPTVDPIGADTVAPPVSPSVDWVSLAWSIGFLLLLARLLAAHVLLRRSTRRCRALASDDPLMETFAATCTELGVRGERVTLLLDDQRTIPIVWGVLRARLLLPAESRQWTGGQLRSVLLHELAHIKRRDPLVLWLSQSAGDLR